MLPIFRYFTPLFAACTVPLADNSARVGAPRVLAVNTFPAEVSPGESQTLRALLVDGQGILEENSLSWAHCTARRPLAELGPIAVDCLSEDSDVLSWLGEGEVVQAEMPEDACSLFGPNPPPPEDGEIGGRPVDPDYTGGFYQPALAWEDGIPTLASLRVRCGIANVSQETYIAWNQGYINNASPTAETVEVVLREVGADPTSFELEVPEAVEMNTDQVLSMRLSWEECPETPECGDDLCTTGESQESCPEDCSLPRPCGGAETYVVHEAGTERLKTAREAISVAWFYTGGSLEELRNGREDADYLSFVDNEWRPEGPGDYWIWAVLRDSRGGVDWVSISVTVN
jgi:hypothetical protein